MRTLNRLNALAVARQTKPGRYGDGGGLYLQVGPSGSRCWVFRFMRDGRAREMGLGPVHTVPLALAREKAAQCRRMLLDGSDPLAQRQGERTARRAAEAKAVTFATAAERFISAHRAGWRNAKHAEQWAVTLTTYAFPVLGDLPVASIETAHVLRVLEPLWTQRTETASAARTHREGFGLGDGARLSSGREPGPLARPSRSPFTEPQQGREGRASPLCTMSRFRRSWPNYGRGADLPNGRSRSSY